MTATLGAAMRRWLFAEMPLGRVAGLRMLVYLFIPLDLIYITPEVAAHRNVPGELYEPLLIGRLLPLPTPTPTVVDVLYYALIVVALAAATGKAPRLLGWTAFALYSEWMVIAMSYGKVDHDRFAFLVALAVLPTVGAARFGDRQKSAAAGWALRMVQLAVVATYFLAVFAKLRFGGWEWLTGSTLAWAVLRRGTEYAQWTLDVPWVLVASQWGIVAFELFSPIVLLVTSDRVRYAIIGYFFVFHLVTYAAIEIAFWPHMVALAAFLPLERLGPGLWRDVTGLGERTAGFLRRRRSRPRRTVRPPKQREGPPSTAVPEPSSSD